MKKLMTAALLIGAVSIAPLGAFASGVQGQTTAKKPAATKPASTKPAKTAAAASHATTGTVKSMSAESLVITRPGKNGKDMTFVVNSSTQKEGNPDVGSKVSVRYRQEGSSMVATAIMAQGKPAAGAKK